MHCRLGLTDADLEKAQYDGFDEPWSSVRVEKQDG